MDAKSAFEGTSSRAISNWQFHTTRGDIYSPELSRSFWEIKDRFNFVVSQTFRTGPREPQRRARSTRPVGQPYSILMGGDPNKDGDGYAPTTSSTSRQLQTTSSGSGAAPRPERVERRS